MNEAKLYCWSKGIRIYPKPLQTGWRTKCKIVIETNGKEKIGKLEYKQDEKLYKKIDELYESIYSRRVK